MSDIRVVVLAAGKGKRMGAAVPKPLVQIKGKPMMVHLLDRVAAAGIDPRPIVVVAPDCAQRFAGVLGGRVEFVLQPECRGTGDAVVCARAAVGDAAHILVLYGDHPLIPPDALQQIASATQAHPEAVVMLTATVEEFAGKWNVFASWGRVLRTPAGAVEAIREVKDATPAELALREVNPALYAFPSPWVFSTLATIAPNAITSELYLTDVVAAAMQEGRPIRTHAVDPWSVAGANTPEDLATLAAMITE